MKDVFIKRADAEALFRNARKELFKQYKKDRNSIKDMNTRDLMLLNAEQMIHLMPSAYPQIGIWIDTAEDYYKAVNEKGGGVDENTPYFVDDIACSECLSKFSTIDNETERFSYCPNCGSFNIF